MLFSKDVYRKVAEIAKDRMVCLYWFYCTTPLIVILLELAENPYKTPMFGILIAFMYIIMLLGEQKPYLFIKTFAKDLEV